MVFSEKHIINFITNKAKHNKCILVSAGKDDCAVVKPTAKRMVFTSDIMFRGSHFPSKMAPAQRGRKAVVANISDLASMGALPKYLILSLGLPKNYPNTKRLIDGIMKTAFEYKTMIIGGDTKCSRELTISITAIGELSGEPLRRSNAKPEDVVAVTGAIGSAFCGLHALLNNNRTTLIGSFTKPKARVKEGLILSKLERAASMDITDGLLYTASEIANASKVSIHMDSPVIPVLRSALDYSKKHNISFTELINTGEDYELLVCLSERNYDKLNKRAKLTKIGYVKKGKGVLLDGKKINAKGYDAFRS